MKEEAKSFLFLTAILSLLGAPGGGAHTLEECFMCRGDESLTKEDFTGKEMSIYADESVFAESSRGMENETRAGANGNRSFAFRSTRLLVHYKLFCSCFDLFFFLCVEPFVSLRYIRYVSVSFLLFLQPNC
jgi:hypothetical protein